MSSIKSDATVNLFKELGISQKGGASPLVIGGSIIFVVCTFFAILYLAGVFSPKQTSTTGTPVITPTTPATPTGITYSMISNFDFPGNDITTVNNSNPEACKTSCTNEPKCVGAIFLPSSNKCFLKNSLTKPAPYPGLQFYLPSGRGTAFDLAAAAAAK